MMSVFVPGDRYGHVIDVLVSQKRDLAATRRFFTGVLEHSSPPAEVTTDRAPAYPRVIEELIPAASHITEQYANNLIEADHGLAGLPVVAANVARVIIQLVSDTRNGVPTCCDGGGIGQAGRVAIER